MKRILALLIAVGLLIVVPGCGTGPGAPGAPDESAQESLTTPGASPDGGRAPESPAPSPTPVNAKANGLIAVVVPEGGTKWLESVLASAETKAQALGLEKDSGYKIFASKDSAEQSKQLEQLVEDGSSAICLLAHNADVTGAAQKALDGGIPLVLFDTELDIDYTAYVSGNNLTIGAKLAEYVGRKLGKEGERIVALMTAAQDSPVQQERVTGYRFMTTMDYANFNTITQTINGFTAEAARGATEELLRSNPKIDAIFAIDDEHSMGILEAVKAAKRTDIQIITGCGGIRDYISRIPDEAIELISAEYSPALIGDAIQTAKELADGSVVQANGQDSPTIITKENVAEFLEKAVY